MNGIDRSTGSRALGDAIASLLEAPAHMATALASALTQRRPRGCEMPPPCWEPRPAGSCSLTLSPGSSATIRVHVTNCSWGRQVSSITAAGVLAGWMKFEPTTLLVDPQERATFLVHVSVPDNLKPGGRTVSGPLLVRGCIDHFARIRVDVAECAGPTCCDLFIDDCADQVHHWYDHFYCARPCRRTAVAGTVAHG
jgi:hypothetical protein